MVNDQIEKWVNSLIPWLLNHGVKILFIIVVSFLLHIILKRVTERAVRIMVVPGKLLSKEAEIKRENTLIRIFNGINRVIIITIAVLMVLSEAGMKIGPILAGAGIVGIAVGFGGQYLIRDIITGLFIIIENQYRVGDVVSFDGTSGLVEDISLRMTTLRDQDGTVHHVPHGEITRVSNYTKYFSRINMNIGISYSANIEHVKNTIDRVGSEMASDPLWKENIIKPPRFLRIDEFSDSSVVIKILGETIPNKQWEVAGELRKRIKEAFDREGIEIPFPQMVVHTGQK